MDDKELFVIKLYEDTLDDKADLGKIVDDYGLTLVHYALLFDKDKLITDSLSKKRTTVPNPISSDDINRYFDVFFIAAYRGKWDVFDILYKNSEEYQSIIKSLKTTESIIRKLKGVKTASGLFESFLKASRSKANENKRLADSYQKRIDAKRDRILSGESMDYAGWMSAQNKINQLNENYERLDHSIETIDNINLSIEDKIKELEAIKSDLNNQLRNNRHTFYERYRNRIKYVEKSAHPFVTLIFRIYDNPKIRIDFISENRSKIHISFLEQEYVVDKLLYEEILNSNGYKERHQQQGYDWKEKKSSYQKNDDKKTENQSTTQKRKKDDENIKPLYGDKWFSPEAYRSVVVLKKEYRALAKKYHPDMYNGDSSVFVAINNEMETILKSIK